jgi:hypothetical protein
LRKPAWSLQVQEELAKRCHAGDNLSAGEVLPLALRLLQCKEVNDDMKMLLQNLAESHGPSLKLTQLVDLACVFKKLQLEKFSDICTRLVDRVASESGQLHAAELFHLCDGLAFLDIADLGQNGVYASISDSIIAKLAVISAEGQNSSTGQASFGLRPMEAEGLGGVLALPNFDTLTFLRNVCPLMSSWPANVSIAAFESVVRVAELKNIDLGLFPDFVLEAVSGHVHEINVNLVCRVVAASASPKVSFQSESRKFFSALASGLPSLAQSLQTETPELSANDLALLAYRLERLVTTKDDLRAPYLELAGTVNFSACDTSVVSLLLSAYTSVCKHTVNNQMVGSRPQVLEGFFDALCIQLCGSKLNAHELHIVLVAMKEIVPEGYSSDPMLALVHHIVRFLPVFTENEPHGLQMCMALLTDLAKGNDKVKEILVRHNVYEGTAEDEKVPASADNKEKMRAFIMSKAIGSKGASHKKLREQNFDPVEDKIEQSKTLMARMSGWMRNAFG